MAQNTPPVKDTPTNRLWDRCLDFIDGHPRVGWYLALITTLNFLLEIFQIVHH